MIAVTVIVSVQGAGTIFHWSGTFIPFPPLYNFSSLISLSLPSHPSALEVGSSLLTLFFLFLPLPTNPTVGRPTTLPAITFPQPSKCSDYRQAHVDNRIYSSRPSVCGRGWFSLEKVQSSDQYDIIHNTKRMSSL